MPMKTRAPVVEVARMRTVPNSARAAAQPPPAACSSTVSLATAYPLVR